jgi:hypothetical protein
VTTKCPDRDDLVRLLDGELTENHARELRAHADGCAHCRDELAASRQLLQRIAHAVEGPAGAHERLLARIAAETAPRSSVWSRWRAGFATAGLGLAATAVVLVVLHGSEHSERGAFEARGGSATRSPARDVDVSLYASRTSLDQLRDHDAITADTAFAMSYRNVGSPAFAMVFAVDAAGELHWIAPAYLDPADDPSSISLARTISDVVLPHAMVLDRPAIGSLRVFTIVSTHPLHVREIEQLAGAVDVTSLHRRWPDADVRVLTLDLQPTRSPP